MGISSNIGARLRERKQLLAAVLGGFCIALAAFFAGSWAGSSGTLTLTSSPVKAPTTSGPMSPNMPKPMPGKMCCDNMKDMMKNMPNMPNMPMTPGSMPNMPPR